MCLFFLLTVVPGHSNRLRFRQKGERPRLPFGPFAAGVPTLPYVRGGGGVPVEVGRWSPEGSRRRWDWGLSSGWEVAPVRGDRGRRQGSFLEKGDVHFPFGEGLVVGTHIDRENEDIINSRRS